MANTPQPTNQGKQLQIKITDEVLRGAYSNAMQVGHSPEEFIIDFMNLSQHQGVGIVNARVIMSPGHLKRALAAMQNNLKIYEGKHGEVTIADQPEGDRVQRRIEANKCKLLRKPT